MSKANLGRQTSRRLAMPSGLLLVAMLLALGLSAGRWGSAVAQDATPDGATPAAECTPAVGDGGDMGGMDMGATPEGMGATPEASPAALVGSEADAETAAAVVAAAENVAACYNSGDAEAFLGLVTDNFIANSLGFGSRDEAAAGLAEDVTALSDLQVDADSVLTYDDGRASVDVTYMQLTYQLVAARWYFVMSGSDYLLDEEEFLLPEPDVDFVTVISATAADDATTVVFDQSPSVPATEAILLHINNRAGTTPREFVLVMLPETAMATPAAEGGVATVDMAAVEAGTAVAYALVGGPGEVDVALVGLPVGTYALLDFGTGEAVPFTITEPAA